MDAYYLQMNWDLTSTEMEESKAAGKESDSPEPERVHILEPKKT